MKIKERKNKEQIYLQYSSPLFVTYHYLKVYKRKERKAENTKVMVKTRREKIKKREKRNRISLDRKY